MKSLERFSGFMVAFLVAFLALVTVSASCTYSPDITSGALVCSDDGQCPRGFTCSFVSNVCCQNGDLTCGTPVVVGDAGADDTVTHFDVHPDVIVGTGGTGPATGSGGAGGTAGTVLGTLAAYQGTWTFSTGATVHTECESSGTSNTSLATTTLIIQASGSADFPITGIWDEWSACTYGLYVDSLGVHLGDTTWQCSTTTSDGLTETWILDNFDVTTLDSRTGLHNATYYREDDYADGTSDFCTQTVTAPLTKN
ncbi:MAG TPA: hypothetical protein VGP07_20555 [Polyangia bacterium]|jgi:hypothetical protein